MAKTYIYILVVCLTMLTACQLKLNTEEENSKSSQIKIERYDQLEYRYLTTGDFSALQQMNTDYPIETRTLIEDVIKLGSATDPEINSKLLKFYQDTTLQTLIAAVEAEYANIDDLNQSLNIAFIKLKRNIPEIEIPHIYAQISALDQSIIIGDGTIGISLDKYLGANFPTYQRYYTEAQRKQMNRENILPDCLSFYLLSMFPLQHFEARPQIEKDLYVGKVQWIVNQITGTNVYNTKYVMAIDKYMKHHPKKPYTELMKDTDFSQFQLK